VIPGTGPSTGVTGRFHSGPMTPFSGQLPAGRGVVAPGVVTDPATGGAIGSLTGRAFAPRGLFDPNAVSDGSFVTGTVTVPRTFGGAAPSGTVNSSIFPGNGFQSLEPAADSIFPGRGFVSPTLR
jgi:hypothetical protein